MPPEAEQKHRISSAEQIARRGYTFLGGLLLPTELRVEALDQEGRNGLEKANDLLQQGFGMTVVYTHPAKLDPFHLMKLWAEDAFRSAPIVVPIADHQNGWYVQAIASPTGTEIPSVVTPETMRKAIKKGKKIDRAQAQKKFNCYLSLSTDALAHAGVVLLASSATREPFLKPSALKPTETLLNRVPAPTRFGVMCAGIEIEGVTDYSKAKGFNIGKRHIIRLGPTFTDEDVAVRLREFREVNNLPEQPDLPFANVDEWIRTTQLPPLVPPAYRR